MAYRRRRSYRRSRRTTYRRSYRPRASFRASRTRRTLSMSRTYRRSSRSSHGDAEAKAYHSILSLTKKVGHTPALSDRWSVAVNKTVMRTRKRTLSLVNSAANSKGTAGLVGSGTIGSAHHQANFITKAQKAGLRQGHVEQALLPSLHILG